MKDAEDNLETEKAVRLGYLQQELGILPQSELMCLEEGVVM